MSQRFLLFRIGDEYGELYFISEVAALDVVDAAVFAVNEYEGHISNFVVFILADHQPLVRKLYRGVFVDLEFERYAWDEYVADA